MKIKKFESYHESETLYIFDFDDTIVKTPSFEELAIDFLKENVSIKDLLQISVDRIGVNLKDLKWENGKIYVDDANNSIEASGNWTRKNNRVYLSTPYKFPYTDISMPSRVKELAKLYNNVENKCIVTARPKEVEDKVIRILFKLGLELPKYGLHMFPSGKGSGNPGWWKGKKIVEILKETGFNKAHFFDDNSKTVNKVDKVVKEAMPNIHWESTKVK